MKTLLITIVLAMMGFVATAQNTGSIKGRVIDKETGESLPQAHISVTIGGNLIGTATDLNGYFTLKPLNPGIYELKVTYTGFGDLSVSEVRVYADAITFVDDCALSPGTELPAFTVHGDKLLKGDIMIDKVINSKEIGQLSDSRNMTKIISAISPGVMVSHNERDFSFRGARVGDAAVFVDGVAIRGTEHGVPGGAISSVTVITGGLPAKYGDTTGGAIIIQTKSYFEWEAERMMASNPSR